MSLRDALAEHHADVNTAPEAAPHGTPGREGVPRPLHNAVLLTAAALAAKGCGFVSLVVATRVLHKQGMGDYRAITGLVAIFAVATDLGLSTLFVRDVAQDRALLPRYTGNLLVLRVLLAALVAAAGSTLAFALAGRLGYGPTVLTGIVIWSLALVPGAVTGVMSVVFQSVERMAVLSALTTASAALSAVCGTAALLLGGRVVVYIAVMAAVNTLACVAAVLLAARITPVRPRLDLRWWPTLLRAALPFVTLTLLNVLYSRADNLLVYTIKGSAAAGLYGVTYTFVDTVLAVAISPFNAAALPAFNRVAGVSRAALQGLARTGTGIMLGLGVPIAVAASMYPLTILAIFGGREYGVAAAALQWLAWSIPCFTVLAILYNALYAARRAADVALTFGVALIFNVALNLLLIPRYSYTASAALTTASEALNVALAGRAAWRHIGPLPVWTVALKVAAAGAVMALVIAALRPLGIVAGLPAGTAAYLLALRLSRAVGEPERAILVRAPLVGRFVRWL